MGKRSRLERLEAALAETRRSLAREQLRSFEGAKDSRRTAGWLAQTGGPNADIKPAIKLLIRRHQDLVDSDPWCARAVDVITGAWIGDGIMPTAAVGSPKRTGKLLQSWATSTLCDWYERTNLYGLQEQAARTCAVRGSVLVRMRYSSRLEDAGLPPLALQVLEPDWLDETLDDGGRIIGGKQYGQDGRLEGFWLRPHHPGEADWRVSRSNAEWVPADQMCHVFEMRRPHQYTGVPFGVTALLRSRDLGDYEAAELLRQKIAACFVAFRVKLDADESTAEAPLLDRLEPGVIEELGAGEDIRFAVPPAAPSGDYVKMQLHAIAAAYRVPYDALTGILSDVNFSSGRMGRLEFYRFVNRLRWNLIVPQLLDPIGRWWNQAAGMAGMVSRPIEVRWTPPALQLVNPAEEIGWMRDAVRAGMMSLREVQQILGRDPIELMDELEEDIKDARRRGLALTVDAALVSDSGASQARPVGSAPPPTELSDGTIPPAPAQPGVV